MMRSLAIAGLTAILVAPSGAVLAAGGDPEIDDPGESVTINGRTFGAEDGLVIDSGSSVASGPRADLSARTRGGATTQVATGPLTKYTWGTSYASSQESNYVWYYGKARAMGNLYSGKRVISVTVGYSLCNSDGSRYSSPTKTSNATSSGSSWVAGSEQVLRVSDNITAPSDCKTLFNTHKAALIDPNIY